MYSSQGSEDDARLDALLRAYRAACPDPELSPTFMPGLWQRIEARRGFSIWFGRMSRNLVTAALALILAMAVYLVVPHTPSPFYSENYVESLAANSDLDADTVNNLEEL
jgi:uncharacterized protein (DUF58 family)